MHYIIIYTGYYEDEDKTIGFNNIVYYTGFESMVYIVLHARLQCFRVDFRPDLVYTAARVGFIAARTSSSFSISLSLSLTARSVFNLQDM